MQKYKRIKGSKRLTSVPIIKTMGTRCPPPCLKRRKKRDSTCLSSKVPIESYFPRNIN